MSPEPPSALFDPADCPFQRMTAVREKALRLLDEVQPAFALAKPRLLRGLDELVNPCDKSVPVAVGHQDVVAVLILKTTPQFLD